MNRDISGIKSRFSRIVITIDPNRIVLSPKLLIQHTITQNMLPHLLPFVVLSSLFICNAQVIPTQPIFNCANPNFQVIYTACSAGDYTKCCAVGSDCCAGGCCTISSWCVGAGTSKEACCDINDPTLCGTGPNVCATFYYREQNLMKRKQLPVPSVVCEGGNGLSSYQCPAGSTCDTNNDSCYLPASSSSVYLVAGSSSSASAAASSTVPPIIESSSQSVVVQTTLPVETSNQAPISTRVITVSSQVGTTQEGASTTNEGGGVSVSVTTAPAATVTKTSTASNLSVSFYGVLRITSSLLIIIWL